MAFDPVTCPTQSLSVLKQYPRCVQQVSHYNCLHYLTLRYGRYLWSTTSRT